MNKVKKALNTCFRICAVCCGLWLIVHRRVIAACLAGVEPTADMAEVEACVKALL